MSRWFFIRRSSGPAKSASIHGMEATPALSSLTAPSAGLRGLKAFGCYLIVCGSAVAGMILNDRHRFIENDWPWVWLIFYFTYAALALLGVCGVVLWPLWFVCKWRGWGKFYSNFCTVAVLLIQGCSLMIRWRSPPSAADYFRFVFGADLPAAATSMRVRGATPADSNVQYLFYCPATDTLLLVKELGMKEILPTKDLPREEFVLSMSSPPSWPDYTTWKDRRMFERRDGTTGRVDGLICTADGTQVYVCKDPLADKTDQELSASADSPP